MKAVILAGGTGSRLMPLTSYINKHMLPVGRHPMIQYGIETLRKAGIQDILIITNRQSAGMFIQYFGSGAELSVSLVYRIQEGAGGIADALQLARPFIAEGEKFLVLLGDNLFEEDLTPYIEEYQQQKGGAMVLLKEVDDPHRYGIPVFHPDGAIKHIEEKPEKPESNLSVTGLYMYSSDVFQRIENISPSSRGELEITDLNNLYAAAGLLTYRTLSGWWMDAGTFESLKEASARYWDIEY
ncbi:sugar phosphate nucleotidyltransferase [Paenibacillus glycanilyticus]|uniref:sugar phosphate nucleotidyltransferase n=1 Tax=Paenibacillus glycanilyticus TaxID=126569 RepID=UPI00203B7CF0|nr:sugar phosphate nucleotidyltransferase [Paenibacillus glycanilyticus]MCM3629005.1 sugar phosphate nucleotidyltransferase [Paenibacillus glycanilyticus]